MPALIPEGSGSASPNSTYPGARSHDSTDPARHATWGRVPCSYARLEQPVKQRPRSREIGRGAVGSPCASPASSRREPFPRSRSPEITRDHPRSPETTPIPPRDHPRSPRDHPRSPAAVGRAANRPPLRAACLAGGCARPAMGRTCPRHIHDTSNRSGRACLRAWSRRARARSWRRQVLAYPAGCGEMLHYSPVPSSSATRRHPTAYTP